MRLVIGVHHFPPRYVAGAEQWALQVATALQRRGHEVRIVCVERIDRGPAGGVAWEDDAYGGLAVRRLSFDLARAPDPWRWAYDNPWVGEHLRTLLRDARPHVFELISGYLLSGRALRVAHELGVPTVVRLSDFWFLCPRITMLRSNTGLSTAPVDPVTCARCLGEEQRRYRLPARVAPQLMQRFWQRRTARAAAIRARADFLRETLNRVDALVTPSEFTRSVHVAAGINPQRFHLSRQGQLIPAAAGLEKTPSETLRVGYLGQIDWHKGVHVLIEAARRLPDAALTVRVHGNATAHPRYAKHLRRLIGNDRRIALAGPYAGRGQLGQVLRQLDVIVVPSLWYENSPMVVLESLAHRTPVLASNLGSLPEVVRHGENGLLFEPGDPGSLAEQLRRLLEDPAVLERVRAGIAPVRSVDDEVDQLEEIYRRVAAPGAGAVEATS